MSGPVAIGAGSTEEAESPRDPTRLPALCESSIYLRIDNFTTLKLIEFYLIINIDIICSCGSPQT